MAELGYGAIPQVNGKKHQLCDFSPVVTLTWIYNMVTNDHESIYMGFIREPHDNQHLKGEHSRKS